MVYLRGRENRVTFVQEQFDAQSQYKRGSVDEIKRQMKNLTEKCVLQSFKTKMSLEVIDR